MLGSKPAGSKLLEMLRLGKSKPWKEVMKIMTGTPNMDTGAFREYFAPLEKWLTKHNKEKNNKVSNCQFCVYLSVWVGGKLCILFVISGKCCQSG